jgi:hypothetical protein
MICGGGPSRYAARLGRQSLPTPCSVAGFVTAFGSVAQREIRFGELGAWRAVRLKALERSQEMLGDITVTLGMGPHQDLQDFALQRATGPGHGQILDGSPGAAEEYATFPRRKVKPAKRPPPCGWGGVSASERAGR